MPKQNKSGAARRKGWQFTQACKKSAAAAAAADAVANIETTKPSLPADDDPRGDDSTNVCPPLLPKDADVGLLDISRCGSGNFGDRASLPADAPPPATLHTTYLDGAPCTPPCRTSWIPGTASTGVRSAASQVERAVPVESPQRCDQSSNKRVQSVLPVPPSVADVNTEGTSLGGLACPVLAGKRLNHGAQEFVPTSGASCMGRITINMSDNTSHSAEENDLWMTTSGEMLDEDMEDNGAPGDAAVAGGDTFLSVNGSDADNGKFSVDLSPVSLRAAEKLRLEHAVSAMVLKDIKEELKARCLKVSGCKDQLIGHLVDSLLAEFCKRLTNRGKAQSPGALPPSYATAASSPPGVIPALVSTPGTEPLSLTSFHPPPLLQLVDWSQLDPITMALMEAQERDGQILNLQPQRNVATDGVADFCTVILYVDNPNKGVDPST